MSLTFPALEPPRQRIAPWLEGQTFIVDYLWYRWLGRLVTNLGKNFAAIQAILSPGITVTIATAKLTAGGANGSMTFTNGILTAQTPAT